MAEAQQKVSNLPEAKHQVGINQGYMKGRIANVRKIKTQQGTLFLTLLKLAAKSEYDHPSTIEIRSYEPIGNREEDFEGYIDMGGVPNNYETKSVDEQTGYETKVRVQSARNEYSVIA